MIEVLLKLECDACGKGAEMAVRKTVSLPSTQLMLAALGWQQFLTGPCLCAECSQNTDEVERVARICARHMEVKEMPKGNWIEPAKAAAAPIPTVVTPGVEEPRREPRIHCRVSDEDMQAALSRNDGRVMKTARELGCSEALIYQRISAGRVRQYSRNGEAQTGGVTA
jgi:hypothetical protein